MRLGFDVGGTKTDAVAVAPGGEVIARVRRPTGWGSEAVVATIVQVAEELSQMVGASREDFASVGVGMPGQVAPGSATVTHAVNLGIDSLDLRAELFPVFGCPITAENDVKAAAVGASDITGQERSLGYLNLGTGVAAGFIQDGVLLRGGRGAAGEVGHISVDPQGPLCKCGARGCIEAFCGGGAVAARWDRPGVHPVRDVFDAAELGDPAATVLRDGLVYGVASAIRVIVLTTDVDKVVLGGGVSALGDRMLTRVVTELDKSAEASPFLRSLDLARRVQLLPVGSPAAALGAALIGATPHEQEALARG